MTVLLFQMLYCQLYININITYIVFKETYILVQACTMANSSTSTFLLPFPPIVRTIADFDLGTLEVGLLTPRTQLLYKITITQALTNASGWGYVRVS